MNTPHTATATAPSRSSPFVALQYRDFRLLWFGQLISLAGSHMQLVTINWHIYILTGSAVALGLTGLVRVLPIIIFSLIGGVFADAHDRRRVLLVTQSLMMTFAALLGLVTSVGWAAAWVVYLLAACASATMAFDQPARQALTPNLVSREHLTNALTLNNMMMQAAAIVGPALAGFVIAGLGIAAVYWINAASFLAVLVALVFLRTPTQERVGAAKITLSALTEGIRFVRQSKIILSTMLLDFFATFFSSASALLPIFARDILRVGPEGLGVLYAAESAGAIIAGIGMSLKGTVRRQGWVLLLSVGLYGVATALYGASEWFWLSFLLLAGVGAADTVSMILRNTIRQLATPDHIRGRMTSVNMIFFMGGPQLGNLEAGIVAALIGAPLSVITGGIATVVAVIVMAWFVPQLRNYRDQ
ncbi:MAG: MFS transporter [Chloroflexi bacterium]|nr:MFS transporter [Chloroflexota bacterium]